MCYYYFKKQQFKDFILTHLLTIILLSKVITHILASPLPFASLPLAIFFSPPTSLPSLFAYNVFWPRTRYVSKDTLHL